MSAEQVPQAPSAPHGGEDREPDVPCPDATEAERDAAAMAWLAWDHRRRHTLAQCRPTGDTVS